MSKPIEYDPVVHGYSVAISSNYDITSIKDVLKILKWIRHENISEEYAREFSKRLMAFDIFIKMKLNWKGKMTAKKLVKKGFVKSRYYEK